jgi:proteic killer suppression protein
VIASFHDQGTEDVFRGRNTKAARRVCPEQVWNVARRKMDYVDSAAQMEDLRMPPGNRLEALKGDRAGQHSIRINDQYRVCFRWTAQGAQGAQGVEIVDYH